jgi:hypothetical protein
LFNSKVVGLAPGARCYDFKNIFAKKLAFFTQNTVGLLKMDHYVHTLFFKKCASFFAEKWQKSRKMCSDHNIGPSCRDIFFKWVVLSRNRASVNGAFQSVAPPR